MKIEKLTATIVQAVKDRDDHPVDSEEHEQLDEVVNGLIGQVQIEDIKEFNDLYNQPRNWV